MSSTEYPSAAACWVQWRPSISLEKIQEESLYYESLKHSGELPIIGVNTYENPDTEVASARPKEVARSSDEEKQGQIPNLERFQEARPERTRSFNQASTSCPGWIQRIRRAD